MDSLTQITLGAAMGEAVLGRKLGNRAMLWGAIGGTIPDLDVMANFVTDEMSALAFHRGISHSFLFAIITPTIFGWLTWRLYQSGTYRQSWYKAIVALLNLVLLGAILFGINFISSGAEGQPVWLVLISSILILAAVGWLLWRRYFRKESEPVHTSWRDWYWLFFWSIFTHPILDAFTPFGTQLLYPFSDYRVAFNTISVVDPVYTVPFLLCLTAAMTFRRDTSKRRFFNWLGVGLSSAYLIFSVANKLHIDSVFERSLKEKSIDYQRYTASPTIFNNILWQGVAETDSTYEYGMYSLLDKQNRITVFESIPKNHHLLADHELDRDIGILRWFSNDYFNIVQRKDGKLQLNDLRYGSVNGSFEDEKSYVFRFVLENDSGKITARQTREDNDVSKEAFRKFWTRVKGI